MFAFTDTPVTKQQLLDQLRAHAAADQIVKGTYWENGKGCAVGCSVHCGDHAQYETRFGIPRMLARIVKAAGYRVSKPAPKKKNRVGPTCVAQFVDGTICRMTTYTSDEAPDFQRGLRLCVAAYESRRHMPAPNVQCAWFERDGVEIAHLAPWFAKS